MADDLVTLGTVTGAAVVMCQEGSRPFATYKPDKYGFNNPDTAWINPEIAFLGDSFVNGQCINQQDHFVVSAQFWRHNTAPDRFSRAPRSSSRNCTTLISAPGTA